MILTGTVKEIGWAARPQVCQVDRAILADRRQPMSIQADSLQGGCDRMRKRLRSDEFGWLAQIPGEGFGVSVLNEIRRCGVAGSKATCHTSPL